MDNLNNRYIKAWDEYSEIYNMLSDKIAEAGIDTNILKDLVKKREKYDKISMKQMILESIKHTFEV
ncbi:MAG: hypothetical protein N3I35_18625 [Clostridia bacterium]|nr:hypothetical protein [Clostridia bacterium]